jgi:hypothetical protein
MAARLAGEICMSLLCSELLDIIESSGTALTSAHIVAGAINELRRTASKRGIVWNLIVV